MVLRQPKGDERIFPVHEQTLSKYFKEACDALGIPDLHFHDLRHEGTSRLFEQGYEIQQVSLVNGHKDWRHLRRIYEPQARGSASRGKRWDRESSRLGANSYHIHGIFGPKAEKQFSFRVGTGLSSRAGGNMDRKSFGASFHTATHAVGIANGIANDLFAAFAVANPQAFDIGAYTYQIVVRRTAPGCYKGELKRYGHDNLPHAGTIAGPERELELLDEEKTIERNYFLFFQRRRLLVWQDNRRVSSVGTLGQVMSLALGTTVSFNPVMTPEATRALMLENHRPKTIEFSVTAPRNPQMYNRNDDSARILNMLNGLGGMSGSFRISANALGMRGRVLDAARTLVLGNSLVESGHARKVKLELEGVDHPIDLFADRLKARITVEMRGRYPVREHIYQELQAVTDHFAPQLNEILGQ